MISTRQARRKAKRLEKKGGAPPEVKKDTVPMMQELNINLLQPWSVPVMHMVLPPNILNPMIKLTDKLVADSETPNHGKKLVGQIEKELTINQEDLEKIEVSEFFEEVSKQFAVICQCQKYPRNAEAIRKETWLAQVLETWIVSQQPGEYNTLHMHANCLISAVMYLKVPKFKPSLKTHRVDDDGSIIFASNVGPDTEFSQPVLSVQPSVGDFFIFGANQLHSVNPYQCEEGDPERRSVSFNAIFKSKTLFEQQKKEYLEGNYEH